MSWIEDKVKQYVRSLYFEAYGEASRILDKLKELKGKGEYSEGRFYALQGLLVAAQRGDKEALFLKVRDQMEVNEIRKVREELSARIKSPVVDDFDRGFFEQWLEVLDQLIELKEKEPRGRGEGSSK